MGLVKAVVLHWGFYSLGDTGDETFLIVMIGRERCIAPDI